MSDFYLSTFNAKMCQSRDIYHAQIAYFIQTGFDLIALNFLLGGAPHVLN